MQSFILIFLCTFSYFDYDWHIHISDRDRSQRSQWWENEWRDRNSLIQHPMHLNDQNERRGGWGRESIREQSFRLKELHSSLSDQMFPSPTLFEVNQDKGVIEESECKDTTEKYHQSKDCRSTKCSRWQARKSKDEVKELLSVTTKQRYVWNWILLLIFLSWRGHSLLQSLSLFCLFQIIPSSQWRSSNRRLSLVSSSSSHILYLSF